MRNRKLLFPATLGFALWMGTSGCSLLQLGSVLAGDPPVPAQYVPAKIPTLVLVESYRTASQGDVDSDRLGRFIEQELTDHKVAPLVNFDKINTLRDNDREAYQRMTIADVGRSVGAKQVIYINITDYSISSTAGMDLLKGHVTGSVKVIDTRDGKCVWPIDATQGMPVDAQTEYKDNQGTSQQSMVRDDLALALADKVGKMFHSWDPKNSDSNNQQSGLQN